MIGLNELEGAVEIIDNFYQKFSLLWDKEKERVVFNQATCTVGQACKDSRILLDIANYAEFLNNKTIELLELSKHSFVNRTRVKMFNSIIFKLLSYNDKKVNGKNGTISLNKCFNDVFGIRILMDKRYSLQEIKSVLVGKFNKIKCIDSSKEIGDYRAIHIYFKIDNMHYQWELQLWYYKDEEKNLESHAKYKQIYTNWEELLNERNKRG